MKKILIIANNDVGLFKFRKELIEELIHPGSYITNRKAKPCRVFISLPDGKFIPELKKLGCEFIDTSVDRRGMNPITDLKLLNHYRRIVLYIKPDIVLTYTIKPNIYGGIVSRFTGVSYISNITGLGTSIESKNFMSKLILAMYKFGIHKADTVFFQNNKNKQLFEEKGIVGNQSFLIPGSGVNLVEHCFEQYPDEQENIKFLFVGRIMRDKGIEEYLDCAESIKKRYPCTIFSIVGSYDENEYKARIDELDRQGIIKYYGIQDDVHFFIKKHHAIVLPSYHEGLSNVLLESSAAGRPVLASNVFGCMETFDNGITGIGFPPQSSSALITAVETFLQISYEDKKNMGKKARKKIEKEFDKKIVIKEYLSAINKILQSRKKEENSNDNF